MIALGLVWFFGLFCFSNTEEVQKYLTSKILPCVIFGITLIGFITFMLYFISAD